MTEPKKLLTEKEVQRIRKVYAGYDMSKGVYPDELQTIDALCSTVLELMREVEELRKDNYILKEGEPL